MLYTALLYTAMQCSTLHCYALLCYSLHCTAICHNAVLCTALHCTALLYTAMLCYALHCYTPQCTALSYTTLLAASAPLISTLHPLCTIETHSIICNNLQYDTISHHLPMSPCPCSLVCLSSTTTVGSE